MAKKKAKKTMTHDVYVNWSFCSKDIDDIAMETKLEKIAKSFGGEEYGTGSDGKERDAHYGSFKTQEKAKKAAQFIRSELRRQGRVSVHATVQSSFTEEL